MIRYFLYASNILACVDLQHSSLDGSQSSFVGKGMMLVQIVYLILERFVLISKYMQLNLFSTCLYSPVEVMGHARHMRIKQRRNTNSPKFWCSKLHDLQISQQTQHLILPPFLGKTADLETENPNCSFFFFLLIVL